MSADSLENIQNTLRRKDLPQIKAIATKTAFKHKTLNDLFTHITEFEHILSQKQGDHPALIHVASVTLLDFTEFETAVREDADFNTQVQTRVEDIGNTNNFAADFFQLGQPDTTRRSFNAIFATHFSSYNPVPSTVQSMYHYIDEALRQSRIFEILVQNFHSSALAMLIDSL